MAIHYLYGAAVQGIQQFIFQTSQLKDIAGASELVEQICTTAFDEFAVGGESIIRAAGKIQFDYDDRASCEHAVLNFPRKAMNLAPGITISQAVVKYSDGESFVNVVNELEERLSVQRNRPITPSIGLIAMKRAPKTGFPAVAVVGEELVDEATVAKRRQTDNRVIKLCEKSFDVSDLQHKMIAYDTADLTGQNDWIAIIHADGNGLGKVVQKIGHDRVKFKKFSLLLDEATRRAAKSAYDATEGLWHSNIIPFRPVVLGGDDMTIICRADIALNYTMAFMKSFERETECLLGELLDGVYKSGARKLTCCAGVAFVKSSYPFFYGYNLAEQLCQVAKDCAHKEQDPNDLSPSCLMFHKVQDSFFVNYKDIIARELTPKTASWQYGPYYINEHEPYWTVETLIQQVERLESIKVQERGIKNQLREWVGLMHRNTGLAGQRLDRAKTIAGGDSLNALNELTTSSIREGQTYYPTYDVLSLYSVIYQQTK